MTHFNPREGSMDQTVYRPACMTPGCSVNCSNGYSCHEQRLGRGPVVAWPVIALVSFFVAMLFV